MSHPKNLLPMEGSAHYFGKVFSQEEAEYHFEQLMQNIPWRQDEVVIFGKRILTSRKTAWYGDEAFKYTYSKVTRKADVWIPELHRLRERVEQLTGARFNSCLLNLYHSGQEGMGWHSDAEAELGEQPTIASLSFGAQRKFVLKHKVSGEKIEVQLKNGSLLIMKGITQTYWVHSLPKATKVKDPRINLTFRNIRK